MRLANGDWWGGTGVATATPDVSRGANLYFTVSSEDCAVVSGLRCADGVVEYFSAGSEAFYGAAALNLF